MALQVWLPLINNVENQGVSNIPIINNGITFVDGGKIGNKCASFNNNYFSLQNLSNFNTISISFWMKPSNTSQIGCLLNYRASVGKDLAIFLIDEKIRFDAGGQTIFNYTYTTDWQHITVTYDGNVKSLYINGILNQSVTVNKAISCGATKGTVGASSANTTSGSSNNYIGLLNDYRIYDHCLSADQIKEISRGMVLHYKMYMPINRLNAKTCTPQNGSWTTSTGYNIIISQKDDYFEFTSSPNAAAGSFNGILLSTPFTGKILKYFWSEVSGVSEFYGYTSGNNDMDFHFSGATVGSPMHAKLRLALYDDNCDFYIPFDTRNIEYDGSGFKNHGTVSGNVTLSADSPRYTGSYSLANGKYITAPGLTYINSGSISFWTKINTLASNGWLPFTGPTQSHYIMATSHGAGVFYHSSIGNGTKTIYEDGKVVTAPTSNGIWHHYVITNVDLTTWTKFMLNNYDSNWNAELQMSDVRVYSTVLDATDVAELYKLGRN